MADPSESNEPAARRPDPDRPTFTVARVAEGGRLSFARVRAFVEAVLGRKLTAEELADQRARWRERFPDIPPDDAASQP